MTRLALKEWAVATDAIARGDMLVTLRKGGIREKEFLVRGERFWLLPTYEHQSAKQVKPAWHHDLAVSQAGAPGRGDGLALRCLCEVHAAYALEDTAGKPSRRSTRKSSNRQKTDSQSRAKRWAAEVRPENRTGRGR